MYKVILIREIVPCLPLCHEPNCAQDKVKQQPKVQLMFSTKTYAATDCRECKNTAHELLDRIWKKKKSFLHLACCSFILLCCAVLLHRPTHCFLVLVWVRAVLISNFPINVTAMAKKRIVTKATKKNIISNCKRLQIALLMIGNQSSSYLGFLFIMKNLVHTT